MGKPPKAMTIRLSHEQAEELELVAAVSRQPVSEIIRSAIAEHLETRKQDKAFRKGLRARIERAQRMINS
jgi:predicted transcriptional regulator